jgi:hypothetical protein
MQGLEIMIPNVIISEKALAWTHDVRVKDRHATPKIFDRVKQLPLWCDGFYEHLDLKLNQRDDTAKGYCQGIARLVLLVPPQDVANPVSYLVGMYHARILPKFLKLSVMDLPPCNVKCELADALT